ncbi:hypothetical protein THOM_2961 [Trachipleistophora hominis]|uniref:Uncharacterized protein n=1 Tax=Trachipleistophora hominis TaxID=72359 RepID=L7JRN2_TRAHO|nr:hypothetical protein THOM_2961 [Trachipleistophora hominis]
MKDCDKMMRHKETKMVNIDTEKIAIKDTKIENKRQEIVEKEQISSDSVVLIENTHLHVESAKTYSYIENGDEHHDHGIAADECVVNDEGCNDSKQMSIKTRTGVDCTIASIHSPNVAFIDDKNSTDQSTPLNSYVTYQSNKKCFKDFIKSFDTLQSILYEKMQTYRELKETEKKTKPYELINFFSNENTLSSLSLVDLKSLYSELSTKLGNAEYEFKQEMIKKRIRCIFAAEFRRAITNMATLLSNNELLSFIHVFNSEEKYFLMVKYLGERKRKCCEMNGVLGKKMFVVEEMVRQEIYMFYVVFRCEYERLKKWTDGYWNDKELNEAENKTKCNQKDVNTFNEGDEKSENEVRIGSNNVIHEDGKIPSTNYKLQKNHSDAEDKAIDVTNYTNCANSDECASRSNNTLPSESEIDLKDTKNQNRSVEMCRTEDNNLTKIKQINFYARIDGKETFLIRPFASFLMQNNVLKLLDAFVFSLTKNVLKDYTHADVQGVVDRNGTIITEAVRAGTINENFTDGVRFYANVILWTCFGEYEEKRMENEGQFEL